MSTLSPQLESGPSVPSLSQVLLLEGIVEVKETMQTRAKPSKGRLTLEAKRRSRRATSDRGE